MMDVPFMFSDEDKDLMGAQAGRDPMGVLPMWSRCGRGIVPHLTEQTGSAEGFQLLVTTFRLYEDYRNESPGSPVPLEVFFVLVEQAFAFSTLQRQGDWLLPGRRGVKAFVEEASDEGPLLSLRRGILGNQLSNGIWGLYRGASYRAGLLHESLRCLALPFLEQMPSVGLEPGPRRELFRLVQEAGDAKSEGSPFSLHHRRKLPTQLTEILSTMPQRKALRGQLFPAGSLILKVAEHLRTQWVLLERAGSYRPFLEACRSAFPDDEWVFQRVLLCEDFVAPVQRIFEFLFHFVGKTVGEATSDVEGRIDTAALTRAHRGFRTTGPYGQGTARRFRIFDEHFESDTARAVVESILECHRQVATDRGTEPWIWREGDRIACSTRVEPPDELDAHPGRCWVNDYYMKPLHSVHGRLR